ncbi:MAG: glycosyltransferase [Hamadaea sp.]|nr:glycosyltransferase [Hamadaea sp.]
MTRTVVIWRSGLLRGSETFVREHGRALTRWRPVFVGAEKVPSVLAEDGDVIAFPAGRWGLLGLKLTGRSRRLRKVIAGLRPALVHAHFGGDGWLISGTAARLRVPLVVTLHGLDATKEPQAPGLRGLRYRRHLRTVLRRAALVIAVSEFIGRQAVALGADPATVRVHHTGVPLPVVRSVPKEWDVVFVGRFVAKKGVDDLIAALALLSDLRPAALLIGDGPLLDAARKQAADLGVDATFAGAQPPAAVAEYLIRSRVLAAPSKTAPDGDSEGLPTALLEAAGHGLPAVSTHHSGIPEAVLHDETGLLGPEGDPAALAAHIRRLLTDDDLRERMGRRARAHVEEHFDLARQTVLLEEHYDALASSPPDHGYGADLGP